MDTLELRRAAFLRAAEAQDVELQDFSEVADSEGALHATVARTEEEEEVTEELPQPPTLEEIEAIQQEAWQEGFEQGKQQGFEQGLKEGRLKGAEQGLKQGLEQGRTQGIEAGQHEISQRCQQLDTLLAQMTSPLEAVDDEVEHELVTLAMKLAHAVVQVELKSSPEAVLHALQIGVAALPQQQQALAIKVNSEDKAILEQSYGDDELNQRQWQLQLDPTLTKGSLRIDSKRSRVEVITEERLRHTLEQFASTPRAPVDEPQYPELTPTRSLAKESNQEPTSEERESPLENQLETGDASIEEHGTAGEMDAQHGSAIDAKADRNGTESELEPEQPPHQSDSDEIDPQ